MNALSGLTIIETAERVCGEWAGRLLADFGAEVIKIERPGGSPTRRYGPHVRGESTIFAYCNTNKKSLVLDLTTEDGRATLYKLVAKADAVIDDRSVEDARALGLGPDCLRHRNPRLVHCRITPFGDHAPADRQHAHPINISSAGGWAWHSPSESDPSDQPLMGAGRFMQDYDSGLDAAIATAAALWHQRRTGKGETISISEVAVQLSRADVVLGRVLAGDDEPTHGRRRYDMGGPHDVFACADGYVHLVMMTRVHWKGLRTLMGEPDWSEAFPEDWLEFHCTPDRVAEFRRHFREWVRTRDRNEVSAEAQKLGVPLVPVNGAADLLANEQYRHRGFFQSLDHPVLGKIDLPTAPYRMTASPPRIVSAAPTPDANRSEVMP